MIQTIANTIKFRITDGSKLKVMKSFLAILVFVISIFAMVATFSAPASNPSSIEMTPQLLDDVSFEDLTNVPHNGANVFDNVYRDLGISEQELMQAFNSKPSLIPNSQDENVWVDDFVSRDLNARWSYTGNGSSYEINNGILTNHLNRDIIPYSKAFSMMSMKIPIVDSDFEVETKMLVDPSNVTSFLFYIFDEYNTTTDIGKNYAYQAFYQGSLRSKTSSAGDGEAVTSISDAQANSGFYFKTNYTATSHTFYQYYKLNEGDPWTLHNQYSGTVLSEFNIGFRGWTTTAGMVHNQSVDYIILRSNQNLNFLQTLRDNDNTLQEVWQPWKTKAAVHKAAVSDSGDILVVAGGYLLDTELHIYRWDYIKRQYVKAFEAGSGVIQGDVYDLAFGDSDNNRLLEVAAASADGHVYLFEQNHLYDPSTNLESKFDLVWQSADEFQQQQVSTVDFYDVDLDLITDLIVGSYDRRIHIYEYTAHSGYPFASTVHSIDLTEKWVSPELDDAILSIAGGDFNNNGLPDFVVGTRSGSVYIFENAGLVVDVRGTPTLLPWDNNYELIYEFTGDLRPTWYPVTKIEVGQLDTQSGDEAILLVWGQGTFALHYDSSKDEFFLEQLVKKYADWETKLPYALDNYADWMEPGLTQNVWHNYGGIVNEPYVGHIDVMENSAAVYAPDGVYSVFDPGPGVENNATATFAFWEGELLASSGNSDPDLYLIMDGSSPVLTNNWEVKISNNKEVWFTIDHAQFSTTTGNTGKTLAIDLDPVMAKNRIQSIKYVKLTLSLTTSDQLIDSIFYPRTYRPLTTATAAMIRPLKVSVSDTLADNKITFGTVDGRFLAYKYDGVKPNYQYQTQDGQDLWNKYRIEIPHYRELWDSYEDDNYNLKTTIWDIFFTPKGTYIPSWRFDDSTGLELTQSGTNSWGTGSGTTKLHSFDIERIYADHEIVVASNNTADDLILIDSSTGLRAAIGSTDLTNYFFGNVNSAYSATYILSPTFGNLLSGYGNELLVFPWYRNGQPFLTGSGSGAYIAPTIYSRSSYTSPFTATSTINGYMGSGQLSLLQTFYAASQTFPSGQIVDLDNDGLKDIVISNGTLAVLWNRGSTSTPEFYFDFEYFNDVNNDLVEYSIFQPQLWDYDLDGDYDVAFSYGRSENEQVYGFDFFEQLDINSVGQVFWKRNLQLIENPSQYGSLISNKYTLGILKPSTSCQTATIFQSCTSAESFWVYSNYQDPGNGYYERLRKLTPDVESQTSFIVGTNPYVQKVEANRFNEYPDSINMGYSLTQSWTNEEQIKEWTRSVTTGDLDNDGNREVIVGDYDNNIYAFEHLSNNTYKRMFKSHNLNHSEDTDLSPYLWEELAGIEGNFTRIVYDHTNYLETGVDFNNDGLNGFVATSGNTVYIFETTGYNDEVILYLTFDIGNLYNGIADFDQSTETITALAVTKDFDGRGSLIAVAINNKLFLFRIDPTLGLVDSFAFYEKGPGYMLPGNPFAYPNLLIQDLMFADMNKDGITELWITGFDQTSGNNGFITALSSNTAGNLYVSYEFSGSLFTGITINELTTSDIDIDNNLEMVIGHSKGVDIFEFETDSPLQATYLDSITSDLVFASNRDVVPFLDQDITNIQAVATGDTDQDLRSEILVSHGLYVSLFEAVLDLNGKLSHRHVWTSSAFKEKPLSIAFDDVNGNGWQEIFVAVEGDDVFAYEIVNVAQPKASDNYLTKVSDFAQYQTTGKDLTSLDSVNIGNTVIITDNRINGTGGIVAIDVPTNTKLWNVSDPFGAQSKYVVHYQNSIVVLSTGGIYAVDLSDPHAIIYSKTAQSENLASSFLVFDNIIVVGFDQSNKDLSGIKAIRMSSGNIAWSVSDYTPQTGDKVFDLVSYNQNGSIVFGASVSDLSTFKTYYFFDETGQKLYNHSASYIDSNTLSSRSVIGDFDGDASLEIATATTDISNSENMLRVYKIDSFNQLFELELKELGGSIYERLPIFATDFNNDSQHELILTFAQYNSSNTDPHLIDNPSYETGLIVAIDITIPVVLWERQISDGISNIKTVQYNNQTIFEVFTDNLGVLGISEIGADVFWAEGGTQSVSATLTETNIVTTSINGFIYDSEFKGLLKRADNFVVPRPFITKSIATDMFVEDNIIAIKQIDMFNKGSNELLVAYDNGTIKFVNYLSGEIMSISIAPFSRISSTPIIYGLHKYGFIIATDTNNLLIYDRSKTAPIKSIKTPGKLIGDVIAFNLTGKQKDSILIQTKQTYGYKLSIYDLDKGIYIWNKSYANKLVSFYLGKFDGSNLEHYTHIIALDSNGVAKLIELPNVFLTGGDFIHPDLGRWTSIKTAKNPNGLTDVYLGSNKGQIFKYSWELTGTYTIAKYTAEPLSTGQSAQLQTTEIMYSPTAGSSEWVELFNPTDKAISLEGWSIRDNAYSFYLSGTIPSEGYLVLARNAAQFKSTYGFEPDFEWKDDSPNLFFDPPNECVRIYNPSSIQTNFECFEWSGYPGQYDLVATGTTLVKNTIGPHVTYTNSEFKVSGTLGTPRDGPYHQKLLITEVSYDNFYPDWEDKNAWIEIYNPTGSEVNLDGWYLYSDKYSHNLPLSGIIKPNGYHVIASHYPTFNSLYGFNPDEEWIDLIYLYDGGDLYSLYNPETVLVDQVGWENYASWNIYANDETIRRKTVSDTNSPNDFESTGGLGTPGFGEYDRSYVLKSFEDLGNENIISTINTPDNELIILKSTSSSLNASESLLNVTQLKGVYDESVITNMDKNDFEIAIPIGNTLVIETLSGNDKEIHSFSSEILSVTSWKISSKSNQVIVVYLANGAVYLIDSAQRRSSCYYSNNCKPDDNQNDLINGFQLNNYQNFMHLPLNDETSDYSLFRNILIIALVSIPITSLISGYKLIRKRRNSMRGN